MASSAERLSLYGPPDRKTCLIAIANAIFEIERVTRWTMAQIGAELDVEGETVENGKYQRNLLRFDTVARMLARWPEHTAEIRQLWEMQLREPESPVAKRRRLIRELAAMEEDA